MIRQILAGSRYMIALAVIGTFLSAVTLVIAGTLAVVRIAWNVLSDPDLTGHGVERLAAEFIQLTDVFLLGTVLYIVALGLYQLFLDPKLPLPPWLRITDLDELKERLVGVIVVLLGVTFLGAVVEWDGQSDILRLGAAIALVIAALGLVFALGTRHRPPSPPASPD